MNRLKASFVALLIGLAAQSQAVEHSFTILDGYFAQALGTNNRNQVVGLSAERGGTTLASLWNIPTLTTFGTLGGGTSYATAINDSGLIAGFAYTSANSSVHAVTWRDGAISDLGTLGGTNSRADAVNAFGVVVGQSDVPGDQARRATIWEGATPKDLGTLGGLSSSATGINDIGQVVGISYISLNDNASQHAALWENGIVIDLGTLGGSISSAHAINSAGQIVGYSVHEDERTVSGTLWSGGAIVDLGSLPDSNYSVALDINDNGQAVGYAYATLGNSYSNEISRAVLWDRGQIYDLNSFLSADDLAAGWKMDVATGISDTGVIVGIASNPSLGFQSYAYAFTLASAVPEPSSSLMVLFGLGLIVAAKRRLKRSHLPTTV
jgi:probable HAF family extracellular repeat protein